MSHKHCSKHGHCKECCHHHEGECSHGESTCSCSCHQASEGHEGYDDFAHELIEMADEAWMEVLKEKLIEHIESTDGANLDKLAKLVTETNKERWKHKLAKKRGCKNFREQLCQFFGQEK